MDAAQEVKSRINIEDVVSEYVQLKRAGRNYKGLSPFTNEKTPSFIVSPEKQIWHDFSSGRGGDVISFIQEVEGLDFPGSLELLARKAGVDLASFRNTDSGASKRKERLFAAVEAAVRYYQKQLTLNKEALEYVRNVRGYEKQTLLDFRFGYSGSRATSLTDYLKHKSFTEDELIKAGLSVKRHNGLIDMFRERLMIPLLDTQGRPVGFTARILKQNTDAPKYINTPATILYDKSRQLFGFSHAKEHIRKSGYVVVVEGNLDVVASWQAGVKNVVASAGTALTQSHMKSLQRFTGDVRLAFDEDRAGQEAAERTIPLAQELGIELSFINIPSGKDPDELIKQDAQVWQEIVESPQYMIDWLLEKTADAVDIKSAPGKRQFTTKVLGIITKIKDSVEQEHYLRIIADKTNTSVDSIVKKINQATPNQTRRLKHVKAEKERPTEEVEQVVRQQHFLAIVLAIAEFRDLIDVVPRELFTGDAKSFLESTDNMQNVKTDTEYAKMLTLLIEESYQHTEHEELEYQAKHLMNRLIEYYIRSQKTNILKKLEQASDEEEQVLLAQVHELEQLRKKVATIVKR